MSPKEQRMDGCVRRRFRGRARGDRGVALVEFALVVPVLMCLLLGMLTGGFALAKKIDITDAVREGARFGATIEIADPDNATQVSAWSGTVKSRIVELSGGRLTASDLCVTLVKSTNNVTETTANCFVADPANSVGDYVVKVRGTGTAKLEAYFFSRNLQLEAKIAARYERG